MEKKPKEVPKRKKPESRIAAIIEDAFLFHHHLSEIIRQSEKTDTNLLGIKDALTHYAAMTDILKKYDVKNPDYKPFHSKMASLRKQVYWKI